MAISVIHDLLELGVNSNASDWHIKEGHTVILRIDGNLVDTDFIPDAACIDKILLQLTNEELIHKYHDSGDLDVSYVEDNVGRFRVNVHKQRGRPSFTLRHVKTKIMHLEELGTPPILEKISEHPRGIVIVGGTTGSGKSTTLAGMLEHVNVNFRRHCVTIEDPIEYEFEDKKSVFEQREVGLDTLSFRAALTHVLRQDPDIIMVGEMRDRESFDAALQAADTGHLVLTTLHATTAAQSINRILDFYDHVEQSSIRMALSINLYSIICQRLLPKAFGGGVVPAVEVMINTPMVRKLLEKDQLDKLPAAIETGRDDGMQSFNQSLLGLVNAGTITEEDALNAASNPDALRMNLKGIELNTSSQILGV
jgi:twitching motility protein PilT